MKKKTILIVDDDREHLIMLALMLRKEGYAVISAFDVKHGIQMAVEQDPDLLLLDIHLNGESGYAIQERLQKIEELADKPVIYVTGDRCNWIGCIAAGLGAQEVVRKPFDRDDLLAAIRAALGPEEEDHWRPRLTRE